MPTYGKLSFLAGWPGNGGKQNCGQYEVIERIDVPSPEHIALMEGNGRTVGEVRFAEKPDMLFRVGFLAISEKGAVTAGLGSSRGDTLRLTDFDNEERQGFSGHRWRNKLD